MTRQIRRANTRAAALIAAATIVSACGAIPGLGEDDTATGAVASGTETTLVGAPVEAGAAAADPASQETTAATPVDDGAAEAARAVGRTGPIRELPGLSAWAEMDLHPFLVEVVNMPPETPLPDGLVLTYVELEQWLEPTSSSVVFTAIFLPMFEREEFKTIIPALLEPTVWIPTGVDEDLENASTRLEFETEDPTAAYRSISFKFEDATAERQARLSIFTSGNQSLGPELLINNALFPWMGDVVVDPTMVASTASVALGRLDGRAELDRRWTAPVDSFTTLSAFYAAPTFTEFLPGVQEFDDAVWPSNEVEVTRADGFDGAVEVYQTDPERDVKIGIDGHYDLS